MSSAALAGATSACFAFVFLLFATSSSWILYSSYISFNGSFTSLGVGPFVAGASTGFFAYPPYQYYGGVVWWSSLNSANVCQPGTSIYTKWAAPHGLCTDNLEFVMPVQSQAIQACSALATIFAFFASVAGCGLGKSRAVGGATATCCSLVGMIFAICAFALWTTWGLSQTLLDYGDYVPLYATKDGGKTITIESSPVPVRMFYGWTFITTIVSFVLMLISTCIFAAASKRAHDEGEFGQFGAYGSGMTSI